MLYRKSVIQFGGLPLFMFYVCCLKFVWAQPHIFITNNYFAENGEDVQITCQLGLTPPWASNVVIAKSDTTEHRMARFSTQCYNYECLPFHSRYTLVSDGYNIYINITSIKRSEDEKFWTCTTINSTTMEAQSAQLFLTVFTTPTAAVLTSSFVETHELSYGLASLTCRTDRCSYKDPVFKWYFLAANGSRQVFDRGETSTWSSAISCNDSEDIYNSKLILRENLTFADNADMSVPFVCGLSFPTLEDELISPPSGNVRFAVQITSVKIHDGDQEMTAESTIIVTENVSHSITCVHGPSRPPPLYRFCLGTNMFPGSRNNTLTFTPKRHQHGTEIYCKAYNLQEPENAVVSDKPKLYINIPVASVTLLDGNNEPDRCSFMNVTENVPKTLSCTADESRPSPTIVWYIGDKERQNHSSNILTFIPEMGDHNKNIHCVAYNLPGFQPIESSKPKLHVAGRPLPPLTFLFAGSHGQNATFYWIPGYDGGYKQSFVLQYRKIVESNWINDTQSGQILNQDTESSLPAYAGQINNLAHGLYQARLIARNMHGEANPVNIMGSTFRIAHNESETVPPPRQSSTPVIITGTIMGCVMLVLIGIIVYLIVLFKRRQLKSSPTIEIKLENSPDTSVQTPSTYEELAAVARVTGSTYDALKTTERKGSPTREYENTTVG